MTANPLRLLLCGYGLALAGAVALRWIGWGPAGAGLTFWLGGAVATLVLAAAAPAGSWLRPAAPATDPAVEEAALAETLVRWERERLSGSVRDADAAAGR